MTSNKIPWDKYEAALLIEAYQQIQNKKCPRGVVLKRLSNDLRKKAENEGIEIDGTFRNFNGMSFMINIMANTFTPNKYKIHGSNLFSQMVYIYKNNIAEFNKILRDAYVKVNGSKNKIYVFHDKYGYGLVLSERDSILNIKFNRIADVKQILKGHASIEIISEEKYLSNLENLDNDSSHNFNTQQEYDNNPKYVNFNDIENLSFTKPIRITYLGEIYDDIKNWSDCFTKVCKLIYKDRPVLFERLANDKNYLLISSKPYSLRRPLKISNNIYAEGNRSAIELNKGIKFILAYCNVKHDSLKIEYIYKSTILASDKDSKDLNIIEEEVDCSDYIIILNEYFSNGYLFRNPLQKRKFSRLYVEYFNNPFIDNDDLYFKKIYKSGFVSEDKVYPMSMVSETLKNEIYEEIKQSLNAQSPMLFYTNLYQKFCNRLNPIFDNDMIRAYVEKSFKNEFDFREEYIAILGQNIDIKQMLISVFMDERRPLDKDEIYSLLPNVSQKAIDYLLSDKEFILNFRGRSYFYKDVFNIESEELRLIESFLSQKINQQECVSGAELYDFIKETIPNILDSNPDVTELGIRNVLKTYLDLKFCFKGDVISRLDCELDVRALYTNFCKQREGFTFEELKIFRDSIRKSYIDYEAVFQNMIRVNEDQYVRKDLIDFNIDLIDQALSGYCSGQYISFCDIINFTEFPTIQYVWNDYVLESYLFSISKKFKLIHATFNKDIPVGGIVKKNSEINDIDNLLIQIIKDNKLFDREKAFNYLLENKYIFTRKVKNIDILIDKAKREV